MKEKYFYFKSLAATLVFVSILSFVISPNGKAEIASVIHTLTASVQAISKPAPKKTPPAPTKKAETKEKILAPKVLKAPAKAELTEDQKKLIERAKAIIEGRSNGNEAEFKELEEKFYAKKPKYYTLISKNFLPDHDEFYVKSIYRIKGKARALISKSINSRASNIFKTPIEYGIGDKLADNLVIEDIQFGIRKKIIVRNTESQQLYSLKISYGTAVSRLELVETKT